MSDAPPVAATTGSDKNKKYCCPLKLHSSHTHVRVRVQASKNKKSGLIPIVESALFGNFAATKQTSLPNHEQRYTFSRTADTKSTIKLL